MILNNIHSVLDVLQLPSPIQKVDFSEWIPYGVEIFFKRDDLIHPMISGNKWRKSYGHLLRFSQGNYSGILTFGGAYSNHLLAVAAIIKEMQIPAIGIVRGEIDIHNPAIQFSQNCGMHLIPLDRKNYKNKDISSLKQIYSNIDFLNYYVIPEGGGGKEGMIGCKSIIDEIPFEFDFIVSACGTGTTLAGLVNELPDRVHSLGISVLKGEDTLISYIQSLTSKKNFRVIQGFHFGGYARFTSELIMFAKQFMSETNIPLDYVYTAKMTFAFDQLLKQNYFPKGSKVVLLHTGGLFNAAIR